MQKRKPHQIDKTYKYTFTPQAWYHILFLLSSVLNILAEIVKIL